MKDFSYWWGHISQAVRGLGGMPALWVLQQNSFYKGLSTEAKPTFREVLYSFKQDVLPVISKKRRGPAAVRGAFGPTFEGIDADEEMEDPPKTTTPPATNERKRPRDKDHSNDKRCVVCGMLSHELADCYYVFEEKAPEGWNPYRKVKSRAQRNLKKPEVIAEINKLKNKRQKKNADSAE